MELTFWTVVVRYVNAAGEKKKKVQDPIWLALSIIISSGRSFFSINFRG